MTHAIGKMANQIYETTKNDCSIYLYGSVTLDDFREGWSDIDIIALTGHKMSDDEESTLVYLRQKMMKDNPIYRSFEGVILPLADLISETPSRAVYWGTRGQKITNAFTAAPFLMKQLTTTLYHPTSTASEITPPRPVIPSTHMAGCSTSPAAYGPSAPEK